MAAAARLSPQCCRGQRREAAGQEDECWCRQAWKLSCERFIDAVGRHRSSCLTRERFETPIGPVDDGNRHLDRDLAPMLPVLEGCEIVGTHDPDEAHIPIARLQKSERRGCKRRTQFNFKAGDFHFWAARKSSARLHARGLRRQSSIGFERITWRHDPPELIELQAFDGGFSNDPVAIVGRVERAAHDADALTGKDERCMNADTAKRSGPNSVARHSGSSMKIVLAGLRGRASAGNLACEVCSKF